MGWRRAGDAQLSQKMREPADFPFILFAGALICGSASVASFASNGGALLPSWSLLVPQCRAWFNARCT
jgi:hypothetical protein